MSETVPKNMAAKSVGEESASVITNNLVYFDSAAVDVLQPTKPIQEYVEYDCSFKDAEGIPDYRFEIARVEQLLLHKSELRGREFQVPELKLRAQIQCSVHYDLFTLAIRFLDAEHEGQTLHGRVTPIISTVVNNRNKCYGNSDEKLCYVFPYNTALVYGTFYPFCALSYRKNLKNVIDSFSKSIALHLYVRNVVNTGVTLPDDSVFLWKVDVSRCKVPQHGPQCFQNEKQLAIAPLLCYARKGVVVHVRLFFKDVHCYVEMGFLILANTVEGCSRFLLTVVHPEDSTERIVVPMLPFQDLPQLTSTQAKGQAHFRTAKTFVLAEIEKLMPFMYTNKLFLALDIQ